MTRKLLIAGAGGHGKVAADAALKSGKWSQISFLDDRYPMQPVLGLEVIGTVRDAERYVEHYQEMIVAIGQNESRMQVLNQLLSIGFSSPVIVHPSAVIGEEVTIGEGTVVCAQAVINPGTTIGKGCIINTGCSVDHDCTVQDGVHISPGAHLAGNVKVGAYTWVGIGSCIIQNIHIGASVIVGAGAAVIEQIPDGCTVVGVPGHIIRMKD